MRTHEFGNVGRAIVTLVLMMALTPLGDLVVTLEAADPQSTHRLFGSNVADRARRTLENLGVGAHIEVTLSRGDRIRGAIQEIRDDEFAVILDGTGARASVRYGDVQQLGPIVLQPIQRSPRESTALKVAGVAVMGAYLTLMAKYNHP